jgi:hypothetical protein
VRPRRRRAALTGDGVSIEIGLRQLAGEYEWGLEKRIRVSVEANGGPEAAAYSDAVCCRSRRRRRQWEVGRELRKCEGKRGNGM